MTVMPLNVGRASPGKQSQPKTDRNGETRSQKLRKIGYAPREQYYGVLLWNMGRKWASGQVDGLKLRTKNGGTFSSSRGGQRMSFCENYLVQTRAAGSV